VKISVNGKYLAAFIVVFAMEAIIAVFIKSGFIRDYFGDVLVVILIYCFIKTFVRNEIKLLPLYIFIFAVLVEIGQYFNLVGLLGLNDFKIARTVIGTSFDVKDIVCYLAGSLGLYLLEAVKAVSRK
jgi:hypothetical protein